MPEPESFPFCRFQIYPANVYPVPERKTHPSGDISPVGVFIYPYIRQAKLVNATRSAINIKSVKKSCIFYRTCLSPFHAVSAFIRPLGASG